MTSGHRWSACSRLGPDSDACYSPRELSKAVLHIGGSREVGPDVAPILAARRCFAVIGPLRLHVIDKSIVFGVFPEC